MAITRIEELVTGAILAIASIAISWALLFESSPIYQAATAPGWARSIWQIVNIPAFFVTVVMSSEVLGAIAMIVQWFLIGIIITRLINRLR